MRFVASRAFAGKFNAVADTVSLKPRGTTEVYAVIAPAHEIVSSNQDMRTLLKLIRVLVLLKRRQGTTAANGRRDPKLERLAILALNLPDFPSSLGSCRN